MKISALIPTYNRRIQLVQAVESVLAQSVPVHEIIVVDDGSTDGTPEEVRQRFGSRVKLLTQSNRGCAAARNIGIGAATGDWIALLDSDDVWYPAKIDLQMKALAELGSEFGVCFTDCHYRGDPFRRHSVFEEVGIARMPYFGALDSPAEYVLSGREPFYTPSLLISRSLLTELGGFDEDLALRSDTDMFFHLCFRSRFCYVAEPLVCIDRNPSRAVGICNMYATRDDRKYKSIQKMYRNWLALPELGVQRYHRTIRDQLRNISYESLEAKLHKIRIESALREVAELRRSGEKVSAIMTTLVMRKVEKGWRRIAQSCSAPNGRSPEPSK